MQNVICLVMGYLLGSVNPAARISRRKHKNLRELGTKNLGASNAMLVFGKKYGAIVMLLDIAKAFLAAKLAKWMFPKLALAGLLAGFGAVVGHVFPFYLNFRGGKGLAAFGGMVLAYDPVMFLVLLTLGLILMFAVNYSFVMPMSAAVLFPILAGLKSGSAAVFAVCAAASALVIVKHWSNIGKARRGEDIAVRQFVREKIFVK